MKIATSPFVYWGVVVFMPEKLGNLQEFVYKMTFLHFPDDIQSFLNAAEAQGCWESELMTVAEYPRMRWQAKPRRKPAERKA